MYGCPQSGSRRRPIFVLDSAAVAKTAFLPADGRIEKVSLSDLIRVAIRIEGRVLPAITGRTGLS
jgi:hypothetical protein